ncbi:hypothetical protein DFH08DRAFT_804408 [Mycena albidolilacea]|uniref:F-box domain-containing protein n=1 Tax=Mycena albidolilacea TaxID=1033008 RepID=A0AAD7EX00_9AGAR|nr:hypothetical protein DFH08DRAFT_804408 [Mycena albidolilacea]
MAVPKTLWKCNCSGIPHWFLYESIPSSIPNVSEYSMSGSPNPPVQKLPVELLGEIFSWTLGDWGVMTDDPSTLLLEPLTISHVCGQWRSISLSMPMLWAMIWIDHPRTSHVPMHTNPKSCLSFPTSTEHELMDEIFALLVPHLSRWQSVDLIFKTDTQQSLLSISGTKAVTLEHVALHVDSWDTAGAESLQSALYARPSVCSIHLLSVPACSQHHVPWAQLIHLDATALELDIRDLRNEEIAWNRPAAGKSYPILSQPNSITTEVHARLSVTLCSQGPCGGEPTSWVFV